MFVVTCSGEGDHNGEKEGGEEGTQPPGFTSACWAKTVQLSSHVQGSEAQASKRNYDKKKKTDKKLLQWYIFLFCVIYIYSVRIFNYLLYSKECLN